MSRDEKPVVFQGWWDQGMVGVASTAGGAGTVGEPVPAKGRNRKPRGGGRKIPVSPFLPLLVGLEEASGEGAWDTAPGEGQGVGWADSQQAHTSTGRHFLNFAIPDYLYFARADGCCLGLPPCSWFRSWSSP